MLGITREIVAANLEEVAIMITPAEALYRQTWVRSIEARCDADVNRLLQGAALGC